MQWRQPLGFRIRQWLYSKLPWCRTSSAFMQLFYLRYTDLASAVQQAEQLLADKRSPLTREERRIVERQLPVWRAILDGSLHEPHPEITATEAQTELMLARLTDLQQSKEYQRLFDVAVQYLLSSKSCSVEAHAVLIWIIDSATALGQQDVAIHAAHLMLAQHDFLKALNRIRPSAVDIKWQGWLPWPIAVALTMLDEQKGAEVWERILLIALEYKHVPPDVTKRVIEALVGYYVQQGREEDAEKLRQEYGV